MIKTKFVLNAVHQSFVVVIIRSTRTMKLSSLFMMMILTLMMIRTKTAITGVTVTIVAVAPVVVVPVLMIIWMIITGTITWMINPSN